MREGLKDDRYALRQPAPDPLVPRHLRLPVRERIRADGTVTMPLDLAVVGRLPAVPAEPVPANGRPSAPATARRVHLGDWRELPVHDLDMLVPGQRSDGPAIVESAATTVLLRTGDSACTTPLGWLDIGIAARRSALDGSLPQRRDFAPRPDDESRDSGRSQLG